MNIKQNQNHSIYIKALRALTPEQRLKRAFDLSDFTKKLFISGLRKRWPDLGKEEFKQKLFERLEKCHNRNY
jgi:hypothetical protein